MKKLSTARTIDHARLSVIKVGLSDPTYVNVTIEHGRMLEPKDKDKDKDPAFEAVTSDGVAITANDKDWPEVGAAVKALEEAVERALEKRGKL